MRLHYCNELGGFGRFFQSRMASMKLATIRLSQIAFLFFVSTALLRAEVNRYLYMSTPDGAQKEGAAEPGIMVFDINDGHKFVKRIDVPIFKEGLRGFTGCTATKCVYYSTTNRRLGCFNVETEKVVWEKQYESGCDRTCITPDGKTLYVPTGWWWEGPEAGFLVVNASNGELIKKIPVGPKAHNSIASLDGKHVFLGTQTKLTMFDATNDKVLKSIEPVGESGVFPYTVDSKNEWAFVCLGGHVGFDVVNLKTGKVPHRVLAGDEPIKHRTHGAGLTPDEKELWVSDQDGKKLFIFDSTVMPPTQKGHVDLSIGGHGWVCFSLDGAYAWSHAPDVFDAKTKKKIAQLEGPDGKPFASSKFLEVHIDDGKVVQIGNEFGLGRAHGE